MNLAFICVGVWVMLELKTVQFLGEIFGGWRKQAWSKIFHANIDGNYNDSLKTFQTTLFPITYNVCCSLNEGCIVLTPIQY